MLYLTCELKVKDLNVLQYASKKGARKLLDEMLRTPHVFTNPVTEQFDVTFLIPDTVPAPTSTQKPLSCLELIVSNKKEEQAEEMLAIYPFCELVGNYWVLCRRVYNAFLVIHIIFMVMFTVYAMPSTEFIAARFHQLEGSSTFHPDTVPLYGLFLLWPVIIMFVELVDIIEFCYRAYGDSADERTDTYRAYGEAVASTSRRKKNVMNDTASPEQLNTKAGRLHKLLALGRILMLGFNYLSNISALAFGSSVIVWLARILLFYRASAWD